MDSTPSMEMGGLYQFGIESATTGISFRLKKWGDTLPLSNGFLRNTKTSYAGTSSSKREFAATVNLLTMAGVSVSDGMEIPIGTITESPMDAFIVDVAFANGGGAAGSWLYTQDLLVTVTHEDFTLDGGTNEIGFTLGASARSSSKLVCDINPYDPYTKSISWKLSSIHTGASSDTVISVIPSAADVRNALAGNYAATITVTTKTLN
jgi:hypothetical protein